MAKKIRKKKNIKSNQVRTSFPVSVALVLVFVAVLGLSYMNVLTRCDALGKEIKRKEAELIVANKRLVSEQDRWSHITSPYNLKKAIKRFGLDMVMPRESQIVRVEYQAAQQERSYAYNF